MVRRLVDVVCAAIALVATAPLLALAADSHGSKREQGRGAVPRGARGTRWAAVHHVQAAHDARPAPRGRERYYRRRGPAGVSARSVAAPPEDRRAAAAHQRAAW